MHVKRTRRAKASMAAVTAAVLLPVAATTSLQTVRVDDVGAAARPARAGDVTVDDMLYTMASRSAVRSAVFGEDPEAVPAETVRLKKGEIAVSSPKGTRVWTVSALSDHGLPVAALKAYKRAAALMARSDPGCRLPWTLLAGIGRIESDHGRYDGARLATNGVSRPRIIGVALDGAGPVAAIRDTDDGKYDGDKVWDRAVGPMQFIPSTWAFAARDGDGDGRMSPHDLDDAAAAAAAYLCSGSGDLTDPIAQAAAIYRYNQDEYYVALVQAFETGYRTGDFVMPPMPVAEEQTAKHRKRRHGAKPGAAHQAARDRRKHRGDGGSTQGSPTKPAVVDDAGPTPKPAPSPAPKPSPAPAPTPKPAPDPAPPQPTELKGPLTQCDGGYCLDGKPLDLGIVGNLAATAVGDFDKDGTVESNEGELTGLLAADQVTMVVAPLPDGKLGIYSINGVSLA